MSKPVLHYFQGRGRAESARLMMVACGVEWTDAPFFVEAAQIAKLRQAGDLMFEQVPLLEIDGMKMVQSMAMVRYLEDKHNMRAADLKDQARLVVCVRMNVSLCEHQPEDSIVLIEMLTEGTRDFLGAYMGHLFVPNDVFNAGTAKANARYLPIFEKELGSKQHLVGNKLSMADVLLFEVLLLVKEICPDAMEKTPNLKAFLHKMSGEPNFAKYLAGPQRMGPNTEQLIAVAKKCFS